MMDANMDGRLQTTVWAQSRKGDSKTANSCSNFLAEKSCVKGIDSAYAHSEPEATELRAKKYKTELCSTFSRIGGCSYGDNCTFIHAEGSKANRENSSRHQHHQGSHGNSNQTRISGYNDPSARSGTRAASHYKENSRRKKTNKHPVTSGIVRIPRQQQTTHSKAKHGGSGRGERPVDNNSAIGSRHQQKTKYKSGSKPQISRSTSHYQQKDSVQVSLNPNSEPYSATEVHEGYLHPLSFPYVPSAPLIIPHNIALPVMMPIVSQNDPYGVASAWNGEYFRATPTLPNGPATMITISSTVPVETSRWLSVEIEAIVDRIDGLMSTFGPIQANAVSDVRAEVRNLWGGHRRASLQVYGSAATSLALPSSDVDCVVIVSSPASSSMDNQQDATREEENTATNVLRELYESISRTKWCEEIRLVDQAKVPVLKLIHGGGSVRVDITCAASVEHSGIQARRLVKEYLEHMPALRPLVMILKSFLVAQGLKDPFTGGLSSYAVTLLVIRFLQHCGTSQTVLLDHYARKEEESDCRPQSAYIFGQPSGALWHADIGTLLLHFLQFYVSYDFQSCGISVVDGGRFYVLEGTELDSGAYCATPWIEDPLCEGRNVSNQTFRMHQVIQSFSDLVEALKQRAPLDQLLLL